MNAIAPAPAKVSFKAQMLLAREDALAVGIPCGRLAFGLLGVSGEAHTLALETQPHVMRATA